MFDPTSRYAGLETAVHQADGEGGEEPRPVRYVRRRFVPPPDAQAALVEHQVTQGERLDVITARYLADPTQFWRVCDANRALRPEELTEEIGRALRIALPLTPG